MDEELPNNIKYWINSFPNKDCVLVDKVSDLASGVTICQLVCGIFGIDSIPSLSSASSATGRIHGAISYVTDKVGCDNLPEELMGADVAVRIAVKRDRGMLLNLLEFLQKLQGGPSWREQNSHMRVSDAARGHDRKRHTHRAESKNKTKSINIGRNSIPHKAVVREVASDLHPLSESDVASLASRRLSVDCRLAQRETFRIDANSAQSNIHKRSPEPAVRRVVVQRHPQFRGASTARSQSPNLVPAAVSPDSPPQCAPCAEQPVVTSRGRSSVRRHSACLLTASGNHAAPDTSSQWDELLRRRREGSRTRSNSPKLSRVLAVPSSSTVSGQFSLSRGGFVSDTDKSAILRWIQDDLGIAVQPYLSPNTQSAGKGRPRSCRGAALSVPTFLGRLTALAGGDAYTADARQSNRTPGDYRQTLFQDPWFSGTLLSEVVAALLVDKKRLVKEVTFHDQFGRPVIPPKLLLQSTVHAVRGRAQVVQNIQLCLRTMAEHIPQCPALHWTADDFLNDPNGELMWDVLRTLLFLHRQSAGSTMAVRGRSQSRTRDSEEKTALWPALGRQSPRRYQGAQLNRSADSEHINVQQQVPAMSSGGDCRQPTREPRSKPARRSQQHVRFSSSAKYTARSGRVTCGSSSNSDNDNERLPRGRSASPVRRRAMEQGAQSGARARAGRSSRSPVSTDRSAASLRAAAVTDALASSDRTRSPSRDAHLSKMLTVAQVRATAMASDRAAARRRDLELRQRLIHGLSTSASEKPIPSEGGALPTAEESGSGSKPRLVPTSSSGRDVRLGLLASRSRYGDWSPPPVSALELSVLRKEVLPSVTVAQQETVRAWLGAVGLFVLEGEGGYSSRRLSVVEETPAIPLSGDRLRNGVFLCELCAILEPHAARHTKLPSLVHVRPASVAQCVQNLEKALWIFRIRRCPPLPLAYLVQPDEIVAGKRCVLWGLLFELMQTYPFACEPSSEEPRNSSYLEMPTSTHLPRHISNSTTCGSQSPSSKLHALPYSRAQRRDLDLALVEWLNRSGVLRALCGPDAPPCTTVLALESYVKDGTLLAQIVTGLLGAPPLHCNLRPVTYGQCLSNATKCTDFLRRCGQRMSTRYLFGGVEERLLRGDWDCALGLLEDVRRYHDCISEQREWTGSPTRNSSARAVRSERPIPTAVWEENSPYLGPRCSRAPNHSLQNLSTTAAATGGLSAPKVSLDASYLLGVDMDIANAENGAGTPLLDLGAEVLESELKHTRTPFNPSPQSIVEHPLHLRRSPSEPSSGAASSESAVSSRVGMDEGPAVSDGGWVADFQSGVQLAESDRPNSDADTGVDFLDSVAHEVDEDSLEGGCSALEVGAADAHLLDESTRHERQDIVRWMAALGVKAGNESASVPVVDLSDGVLLHGLIVALERSGPISGFNPRPRSAAHRVQNVRRCLEFLAEHAKRISLSALSCEEEIVGGDQGAAFSLLAAVKKAYAHRKV